MNDLKLLIMILMAALGTLVTRFFPFLVFNSNKPTPKYLEYLGKYLPPAVFGMLVVYCLKGISFSAPESFLPELIAVLLTVILHLGFKKMLVSIAGGTAAYMILVNLIFI